jgi:ATP-dependent DNA helicase RecG
MKRLLVGDVGCGKTVVAALAAYMAVQNRKQVAVMAPTQILAQQHFDYFIELSKDMGFSPVLLSGDQKPKERERIYEAVQAGIHNLIIGTHSLIQKELDFAGLGLVIIDEQHRFGVRQRALLEKKGNNPHILVMTATPIPRTLAITVYGDMDLSMIQEYPRGHQPVDTYIVEEKEKRWAFGLLKERLSAGQQAFVICPAVDESEEMELKSVHEMHDRLKGALTPPYRIGLVHGRLSSAQREKNMDDFHKGRIHILVGTTVVEVGVHVPNATVMIIEHPERFGLTQLHQLRGRVGRGQTRGTCLFIKPNQISTEALSRLKILVETHDGFQIAQKDLELRGHGELMGMRQSGLGELDISEMIQEQELLISAKREAQLLLASDPGLQKSEHRLLRDMIESILDKTMDL